jgi:hypothetical protein
MLTITQMKMPVYIMSLIVLKETLNVTYMLDISLVLLIPLR